MQHLFVVLLNYSCYHLHYGISANETFHLSENRIFPCMVLARAVESRHHAFYLGIRATFTTTVMLLSAPGKWQPRCPVESRTALHCISELKTLQPSCQAVPTHLKNSMCVLSIQRILKPDANDTTGFPDLIVCTRAQIL